jgi:hypothetical protein
MSKIGQLKEQEQNLRNEIYALEKEELTKRIMPKAKKLIGKCYKYRNSYGGDQKPWWLYQKVVEIKSINDENRVWLKVNTFQQDCIGDINFKKEEFGYCDLRGGDNYQEISSKEYEMEKNKLIDILKTL